MDSSMSPSTRDMTETGSLRRSRRDPVSTFHGASARRSLKETASALRAQKDDAFSGTLPRKSACFFWIVSDGQNGDDLIPVHLAGLPETEAPVEGPGGGILRLIGEPAALRPPTGEGSDIGQGRRQGSFSQAPAALSLGLPRQEVPGSFARGKESKGPSAQSAKARFSSPAISSSTAFATSKYSQSIRKPCIMPITRQERTVLPASTSFAA